MAKYLTKLDGRRIPGVPDSIQSALVDACAQIRRRTHWQGWFHRTRNEIQFHPGDTPKGGCVSELVFQRGRYLPIRIDDVCRQIESARMPLEQKQRLVERSMREDELEIEREQARLADDMTPELQDVLSHYARRIQTPHSQRVFVMN